MVARAVDSEVCMQIVKANKAKIAVEMRIVVRMLRCVMFAQTRCLIDFPSTPESL